MSTKLALSDIALAVSLIICTITAAGVAGKALSAENVYRIPLEVHLVDKPEEIPANRVAGYSAYGGYSIPMKNKCVIYAIKPENWDDTNGMYLIGHEVGHCLYGPHDPNTKEFKKK